MILVDWQMEPERQPLPGQPLPAGATVRLRLDDVVGEVEGCDIHAVFACPGGCHLVMSSFDDSWERSPLCVSLLDAKGLCIDSVQLWPGYVESHADVRYETLAVRSPDQVDIAWARRWTVRVLAASRLQVPGLLDPGWIWRKQLFRRHFLIRRIRGDGRMTRRVARQLLVVALMLLLAVVLVLGASVFSGASGARTPNKLPAVTTGNTPSASLELPKPCCRYAHFEGAAPVLGVKSRVGSGAGALPLAAAKLLRYR
jgi:hypothetical protein